VSPFTLIRADRRYEAVCTGSGQPGRVRKQLETFSMPVSLPHALDSADLLVPTSLDQRFANWLKAAQQRRAERLLAQSICAAGIRDFSTHR